MTAGEYARQARQVLTEINQRHHLPIVVGGTGLYLRALLEGLFPGPQRSEELRERLRESAASHGSGHLHRILQRLDRAAAEKIHANDIPKLIRAIEVCLASRQKMSELWQQGRDPLRGFRILRLGLDPERAALYDRINQRARRMFETGLVEETQRLLQKYGATARPLASLGYRQAVQLLRGELTREQAVQAAQQAHRNYAKRQMTWFRREPDVVWLKGFGDDAEIQREALRISVAAGLRSQAIRVWGFRARSRSIFHCDSFFSSDIYRSLETDLARYARAIVETRIAGTDADLKVCTPQQARAGLAESAARCAEMLAEALGGRGRVSKFLRDGWAKPWPVGPEMLCYMLAHEAHHRGQVSMLAHQMGFPLPIGVASGIWNWEKLWKECGAAGGPGGES